MSDVDMFKYGQLVAQVEALDKKVDKLERNIEQLLELANRGKGGMWFGMVFLSTVSSVIGYITSVFVKH
jgi:hypothetical protein